MENQENSHHENLAKKISWNKISTFRALREYIASFAGVQSCSDEILKALQDTREKTLNILEKTSEKK